MATNQPVTDEPVQFESQARNSALLMALAGIAFVGYGVVFLVIFWGVRVIGLVQPEMGRRWRKQRR